MRSIEIFLSCVVLFESVSCLIYEYHRIKSPLFKSAKKIENALTKSGIRCKDISFKSLNCVVYSDTNFNTVQCTKPSLIILKDAGIFNMRALQIDFHAIPLVHTFLSYCLISV